jgi:hypothetical protein
LSMSQRVINACFTKIGPRIGAVARVPFSAAARINRLLGEPLRPVLKPVATTVPLHRRAIVGTSQCHYSAEQRYTFQTTLFTIAMPFE